MDVDCCGYRNLNTRASFAACLMVASVTGCGYTFGVYSSALSEQFALSNSQLDTLSAVYFITGIISWVPGLITDIKGPKFVVRWFGALEACALSLYWLVSRRYVDVGSQQAVIATLASISVIAKLGSAGIVGGVFSSLVRTHGTRAGTMVGIAKGWVGICAGMVTQIYTGLVYGGPDKEPRMLDFLLFVAIVIGWGTFLPSQFLLERRDEGTKDTVTQWDANVCYAILVFMGALVTTAALTNDSIRSGCAACPAVLAVFIIVVWNAPFGLLASPCTAKSAQVAEDDEERAQKERTRGTSTPLLEGKGDELTQYDLRHMLQTGNFWLLLWTTTILIGCGIMIASNAGQMCKALHIGSFSSTAVTLFSVSNSFARVVAGLLSDRAYHRGVARPIFFTFAALTMALAQFVLVIGHSTGLLAIGIVLCGLAFGSTWPLMVLSVAELFGSKFVGGNYMVFDGTGSALGTLAISKFLAETWYERHTAPGAKDCFGARCFQNAHIVMAALALSSAATSFTLWHRSRPLYRRHLAAMRAAKRSS
jgi:MFS family permease